MASETEISNLALLHLGHSKKIASLETERSTEAIACRSFFDVARDATLRDFAWPFSTKIVDLNLVEENPNTEWAYSYTYPSDCVKARRILSGVRYDTLESKIPYKIVYGSSGHLIYTDQPTAQLEYTMRVDDVSAYPPDFMLAHSYRLAAYIAPSLTGGDPTQLKERNLKLYQLEISTARASASNEEGQEVEHEAKMIRARD